MILEPKKIKSVPVSIVSSSICHELMGLVNSGSWWWTGRPGMLWFMGSQRVGHNWATELNWTELMGPDAMILVFWMLSFRPAFSLSSLLLSRGSLVLHFLPKGWCHLCIWSYWYFSQQSWFQHVIHLAWHFTWYKQNMLNKHGDNIQPWHTPFPILNKSVFPYPILTVAFLTCIQVSQETGKAVWYSHL